jgi:tryptophanyl-tRNA synthetase
MDDDVKASLKLGLFSYPVLQAADILVYRATHVPVGEDQRQHLEFARKCVTNFNHAYGPVLKYPETIICECLRSGLRIQGVELVEYHWGHRILWLTKTIV